LQFRSVSYGRRYVMPGKSSKASGAGGKRGRSAVTGRFVKQSTVRRHPSTTVNERASRGSKKSK
jgi:hypothetical protein